METSGYGGVSSDPATVMSPSATSLESNESEQQEQQIQGQEEQEEQHDHCQHQQDVEVVALGSGTSYESQNIIATATPQSLSDEEDDVVKRAREMAINASKILGDPHGTNASGIRMDDKLTMEELQLLTRPDPKQRQLIEEAAAAAAAANNNQQIPLVEKIGKVKEKVEAFKAKEKFEALKANFLATGAHIDGVAWGASFTGQNPAAASVADSPDVASSREVAVTAVEGVSSGNSGAASISLPMSPDSDKGEHVKTPPASSASVSAPVQTLPSATVGSVSAPSLKINSPSPPNSSTTVAVNKHGTLEQKPLSVTSPREDPAPTPRPTPTMSSTVWKKRSGYGKYSITSAWSKRRLELVGSKLIYYKLDVPQLTPPSLPPSKVKPTMDSASAQIPSPNIPPNTNNPPSSATSNTLNANASQEQEEVQQQELQHHHQQQELINQYYQTLPSQQQPKKDFRQLWEQASAHIITKAQENLSKLDPNYYENTGAGNHGDNNRGSLDLIQENATVSLLSDCHTAEGTTHSAGASVNSGQQGSGIAGSVGVVGSMSIAMPTMTSMMAPPTPFGLAILVKMGSEVKWKICFESQKEQIQWLAAITDVVVQRSVDCYNDGLLFSNLIASDAEQQQQQQRYEGVGGYDDNKVFVKDGGEHIEDGDEKNMPVQSRPLKTTKRELWKKDISMISLLTTDSGTGKQRQEAAVSGGEGAQGERIERNVDGTVIKQMGNVAFIDGPFLSLDRNQLYFACVIVNVSLCLARMSSTNERMFWYLIVFINVIGLYLIEDGGFRQNSCVVTNEKGNSQSSEKNLNTGENGGGAINNINEGTCDLKKSPENDFKPVAGSSSIRVEDPENIPLVNGHNFVAWKQLSNDEVKVRSHGYTTTKKKISSPKPLYRLVAMDILSSAKRIPHIASLVKLPHVSFDDDDNKMEKTWHSPDVFVISINIPTESPLLGKPTDDGFGFTVAAYYVMTQETRDILRRVTSPGYDRATDNSDADIDVQSRVTNSVRLWEEWCRKSPNDPDFQARFKFIANIHNQKEIGIPSYIGKYCGKPVLIKRRGTTGFLFCHPKLNAMEFVVSIHPFPYLVKKAAVYMKDNVFDKALISFAYVIEGRRDDELPEAAIGEGFMLCYPNPKFAIRSIDFFGGHAPSSVVRETDKKDDEEMDSAGECQ